MKTAVRPLWVQGWAVCELSLFPIGAIKLVSGESGGTPQTLCHVIQTLSNSFCRAHCCPEGITLFKVTFLSWTMHVTRWAVLLTFLVSYFNCCVWFECTVCNNESVKSSAHPNSSFFFSWSVLSALGWSGKNVCTMAWLETVPSAGTEYRDRAFPSIVAIYSCCFWNMMPVPFMFNTV